MATRKKSAKPKTAGVNITDLDASEKLTKAGAEIEVLLREIEHSSELNERLKLKNGEQRGKIELLEDQLEHRSYDRLEITSDMSRQYKTMQAEMMARIHALEGMNADLKQRLASAQYAAQESAKEHARTLALKDEIIDELNVKMSYLSAEFETMLTETLAKMSRKLEAVSLRWKENDGMHLSESTTKRLSDFNINQISRRQA